MAAKKSSSKKSSKKTGSKRSAPKPLPEVVVVSRKLYDAIVELGNAADDLLMGGVSVDALKSYEALEKDLSKLRGELRKDFHDDELTLDEFIHDYGAQYGIGRIEPQAQK